MRTQEQLVLQMLSEKDMYGYEIAKKINGIPGSSFVEKIGTLYPILHSLEKKRCLKSYVVKQNDKSRKYYKLIRKQGGVQYEK